MAERQKPKAKLNTGTWEHDGAGSSKRRVRSSESTNQIKVASIRLIDRCRAEHFLKKEKRKEILASEIESPNY